MMRRFVASLSAGMLALSMAPAVVASPESPQSSLDWQPCGVNQFCTWIPVPIDYGAPERGTIALRAIRIPARSPQSNGTIVVNPGGPGAPAIEFTRSFAQTLPDDIRREFDIVSFDTRGTGDSSPLRCVTNTFLARYLRLDNTPTTLRQQQTWLQASARWSIGCRRDQPLLAANMSTANIVRDLESIREALGEPQLNFIGFSYGTQVGARYAQAFPDRVGRFILDGAVDPRLDAMEISQAQAAGFQLAIRRFADRCVRTPACTLGRSRGAVITAINTLLANVEHAPIPTTSGRTLVEAEVLTGIVTAMYAPSSWPSLWQALAQAIRGNGTALQRLADVGNGQYGPNDFSGNFLGPFLSTTCTDLPRTPKRMGLAAASKEWSRGASVPKVSALLAWSNAPCTAWFQVGDRPKPVSSTTRAPILMIGTTFDPATPYQWSRALHQQLPTSTLLTLVGDGHTAFGTGSACIDTAATAYLLTGVPPVTTRCSSN